MPPEIVKKLHETTPEFRALLKYLGDEVAKLDSLDGLGELKFAERAYEATARLRARDRLLDILSPLLTINEIMGGVNPKDYAVDVDDIPKA